MSLLFDTPPTFAPLPTLTPGQREAALFLINHAYTVTGADLLAGGLALSFSQRVSELRDKGIAITTTTQRVGRKRHSTYRVEESSRERLRTLADA